MCIRDSTRTVLSCIPFSLFDSPDNLTKENSPLLRSVLARPEHNTIISIYKNINTMKMFNENQSELLDLFTLNGWEMKGNEFVYKKAFPFKLIFCDIRIEDREVGNWCQPLFEATGKSLFGLFIRKNNNILEFLIKIMPEIGCFDFAELGPSVQKESAIFDDNDAVERLF